MSIAATAFALAFTLSLQQSPSTHASSDARAGQATAPSASGVLAEELWDAARAGDAARVARALDKGADVNAKSRYGMTALTFAADKGHIDVVKLLLDRGADLNGQDTFYKFRALDMALMNNHRHVAMLLLERGSQGAGSALMSAVRSGTSRSRRRRSHRPISRGGT